MSEAAWYQNAVFYQLPVKSFFDGNGDGLGDFVGLTAKLDYLKELGIDCVWLLPFFPSPLRDDGYDVTDYRAVHPGHGTIQEFRTFVHRAHERGIRIAAEMVINHTSDQHPWFQAARGAPPGSPLRDFYSWSETDQRFRGVPVLYADAQKSNWTWDATAKAFYWHRFFSHQPDLNYDNPEVRSEILKILRFWLDLGVDGLCLNGVPYLVEREGTSCEHLPETHAVLKEIRQALESAYPHAMIQAGVNAWPADACAYFGEDDECHMAPNLALAQRLFMAVRQEERHPVTELIRQTPTPPPGCQWVTLLRNHDELTLALATDEERDYMYREYAADPRMRLHAGIRRRLAPLADNSRRRIELLFGLLFSLPGSPVLYYGDEIGMGDNVFLGGRNGVRTPMQWRADRNAGFSSADFAQLFAPPVMDPLYGYQSVNVESQRRDPSSLFHWVRRLVALRKSTPSLSQGELHLLEPANRKVVAFVRRLGDESVLAVANLARTAQPAELDLSSYADLFPVEMFGRAAFPRIGAAPYLITLAAHGFHWFQLQKHPEDVASRLAPVATEEVDEAPTIEVTGGWDKCLEGDARTFLEREVLPGFLRSQRWFGGKARSVESVRITDAAVLRGAPVTAFWVWLEVQFAEGRDLYFLPLAVATGPAALRIQQTLRPWVVARLHGAGGEALLHDALAADEVCSALLAAIGKEQTFETSGGRIQAIKTAAFVGLRGNPDQPLPVTRAPPTSSNSLVFFGRRLLLKLFRRLEVGTNPDYEIGRFLTEDQPFDRVPPVAGTLVYHDAQGKPRTLALLQALVANQGDGWSHAVGELGRYYERAWTRMSGPDPVPPDSRPLPQLADATPPAAAVETIGSYLQAAEALGRRTAEMHVRLGNTRRAAFAPEPLTAVDIEALKADILTQGRKALAVLDDNLERLSPDVAVSARQLQEIGRGALAALEKAENEVPAATKLRVHGDYHLGQVLWVENDYVILDFEGEPTRTVEERRAKFSPMRDVAGMLRSYHYAAYAGLFAFTQSRPEDFTRLEPWAELWQQWVSAAFLRVYRATAGEAAFIPRGPDAFASLLDQYMLAKAFFELVYELNNRPDWVRIPLRGILSLLSPDAERP